MAETTDSQLVRIGRYELVTRLAVGGMAELFLARERGIAGLERLVVIKRILPHLANQQSFVEMFLREARIVARLAHPNVVQIFELNESDGAYYIVMEYIHGSTVRELQLLAVDSGVPFPLEVGVSILAQAARGLHAAHELTDLEGNLLGLVHRDVSPHNLMVTAEGNVKLLDFGVAKATEGVESTYSGNLKGKFAYMSPEQCMRSRLDRRSDIFGMGIVAWELFTGERLFRKSTELETMKAITGGDVPRPTDGGRDLPLAIEDAVMKALAHDRDRRWDTAEEFRQALLDWSRSEGYRVGADVIASFVTEIAGNKLDQRFRTMKAALERALTNQESEGLLHRTGSRSLEDADTHIDTGSGSIDRLPLPTRSPLGPQSFAHLDSSETVEMTAMNRDQVAERVVRPHQATPDEPEDSSNPMKWVIAVIALLSIGVVSFVIALNTGESEPEAPPETVLLGEPLKLGWAPTVEPGVVIKEVEPLHRYLERELGRPVPLVMADSYDDLASRLKDGEIDFAVVPPLLFVNTVKEAPRIEPLAFKTFQGATRSDGLLLVRMDSDINELADLEDKAFCFTNTSSTSGYFLPRAHIRKAGFDPDTFISKAHMSGEHFQVLKDLLDKKCDAAASYSGALLSANDFDIKTGRIRTLAITGHIPQDVVAAGPHVSQSTKNKMVAALLAFDPMKEIGERSLGKTQRIESFVRASDGDYESLRSALEMDAKSANSEP